MTHEKEMARYRSRVTHKRAKRGRRKTDVQSPPYFTTGTVLQFLFILFLGMVLLMACAKGAL